MGYLTEQIKSMVDEQTTINEAARFGNREIAQVLKKKENFRIGLEFEFVVNKVDNLVNSDDPNLYDDDLNDIEPDVDRLAQSLAYGYTNQRKIDAVLDTIDEIVSSPDQAEIEAFLNFDLDDVLFHIKQLVRGYRSSRFLLKTKLKSAFKEYTFGDNMRGDIDLVVKNIRRAINYDTVGQLRVISGLKRVIEPWRDHCAKKKFMYGSDAFEEIMGKAKRLNTTMKGDAPSLETRIDYVKRTHPLPPHWVDGVVLDSSVKDGVELVTKPLSLRDVREALYIMDDYVSKIGEFDDSTGLHVNISMRNGFDDVNPAKMITMMDLDFFQNLSPSNVDLFKYPVRSDFVENLFDSMTFADMYDMAVGYMEAGTSGLVKVYEQRLKHAGAKYTAINLRDFLKPTSMSTRRIEFRFLSMEHHVVNQIYLDILNIMYVILISTDEDFLRNQYLNTIVRQINRRLNRMPRAKENGIKTFDGLIKAVRERREL